MKKALKEFENFLKQIDLKHYRTRYQPIKIVEMDLPKNIQAIKLLYLVYWENRDFIDFDEFYERYNQGLKEELEGFREKTGMCEVCFYKGLPARIYRTWASLVTQIHAGYVAESVFGKGTVEMSEALDHKGADFQVKYKNSTLNYQIKKQSFSREVRAAKPRSNKLPGDEVNLFYNVPESKIFENPKTNKGDLRKPYSDFINNKQLERYDNGFVVFTKDAFIETKHHIDKLS